MKKWTKEQQSAIDAKWRDAQHIKRSNILVNAAAGSGKTAVLVERIIKKISHLPSDKDYCSIDNLLVVTFTNAAAKEMQERISAAITKKHQKALDTGDYITAVHFEKQLSLVHTADITTIDSFCLKMIRSYFHLLNIDPDFNIIDSAEAMMLSEEVLEEFYEKYYDCEDLQMLLSAFSGSRDEKGLSDIIKRIYQLTRNQPEPDKWLDEKLELVISKGNKNPFLEPLINEVYLYAEYALKITAELINEMINYSDGISLQRKIEVVDAYIKENPPEQPNDLYYCFGTYYKAAFDEFYFYKSLLCSDWDEIVELSRNFEFLKLSTKPAFSDKEKLIDDKEFKARLKSLRDKEKNVFLNNILPLLVFDSEQTYLFSLEHLYPVAKILVKYVKIYSQMYSEKKASKNMLSFSDVEHYCLKLFTDFPEIQKLLKDKYEEILMDEYQDSNYLQEAIFEKISRGDNLFMVGDMKQSIYRFRSSDPALFKSKCVSFSKEEDSKDRKIVLSKNFRSRFEVLESINSVFSGIMSEEVGELIYDEDQQLNLGDESYSQENTHIFEPYKSECCVLLDKNDSEDVEENLSKIEIEARFIAKKINELKDNNFLVRDTRKVKKIDDNGEVCEVEEDFYRPIQNKDIAILMSSYKGVSDIYIKELSNLGIDCWAQTGGYFDRNEIQMVITLLKVINNPYNDVPLIGVLRSPIFSFSDDDLCAIRTKSVDSFYDAVISAAGADDSVLAQKCKEFVDSLNKWRKYKTYMSCDKLIWTLYEESGLYTFCKTVYGEDAATNLRLLFSRAKSYESTGFKGLFNFIRYIAKMKNKEEDLGSAVLIGENSDVVRLMTIHKSKGLEFKVVFLAGCHKRFNDSDIKGRLLLHKDLGFGLEYINHDESFSVNSLQKISVSKKILSESVSEEMRKLYVAMTRAKEKLYVTAVAKKSNSQEYESSFPSEYNSWLNSFDDETKTVSVFDVKKSRRFIDWIAPVAINSDNWKFSVVEYSDIINSQIDNEINPECIPDNNLSKFTISEYEYPYIDDTKTPVKVSVSEIKKMQEDSFDNFDMSQIPDVISKKNGLSGAQRGSAIHYVMQKYIPKDEVTFEDVKSFIEKLYEDEELSLPEMQSVDPQLIVDFYSSMLGKRILKSDKVFREVPFEVEIRASDVFATNSNEHIILQGIIDCYFYEGNEIVIVDYKSDKYDDINKIKEKYRTQIDFYKYAVEKICKKTVKNQFLYLFFSKSMLEY